VLTLSIDLDLWVRRGRELECFPDDRSLARYYTAWTNYDHLLVSEELERIFCGPYPMPGVNWLGVPGLMRALDAVQDGPKKQLEDWDEGDFVVTTFGREEVAPGWLAPGGSIGERWDALIADLTRTFVLSPVGQRFDSLSALVRLAVDGAASPSLTFSELVRAATASRFLLLAAPGSESLRLADPSNGAAGEVWEGLRDRAESVAGTWWTVLGEPSPPQRPITLIALRSARNVLELDNALRRVQSPANQNLLSFLRCQDLPL